MLYLYDVAHVSSASQIFMETILDYSLLSFQTVLVALYIGVANGDTNGDVISIL